MTMDIFAASFQEQLDRIMRRAGDIVREGSRQQVRIETKSFNNLVTEIDRRSEEFLVTQLSDLLPGSGFIAEEGTGEPVKNGYNWIIDPIDGTTNFIHGIPAYCICIALEHDGQLLTGYIYDTVHEEMFRAARGRGAYLNNRRISVSGCTELKRSLLATGFPYDDFEFEDRYFGVLKTLTHETRGIRRLGSAALDMAYVACGRFEAFYEYGLNPWDIAAGIVIVEEAGGRCTDFSLGDQHLYGEEIIATNKHVHEDLHAVIAKHFSIAQ